MTCRFASPGNETQPGPLPPFRPDGQGTFTRLTKLLTLLGLAFAAVPFVSYMLGGSGTASDELARNLRVPPHRVLSGERIALEP